MPGSGAPSRRRATKNDRGLRAPGLPKPSWQAKGWRYGAIAAAVALVVTWLVWYAATPEELPVSDRTVNANGTAGRPLYIGMFRPPSDFERTLRMSGVKVHATSNQEVRIRPLLCRRGAVGVTTDPEQFCSELLDPAGERLTAGDSIVLEIESDTAASAAIDRIRIAYREDVRWDTQPAGNAGAVVLIAARPESAPESGSGTAE